MSAPQFTPGPWRTEIDNVFAGPESNSIYVADCNPMRIRCADGDVRETNIMSEANANLIAAAPDLYEALSELMPTNLGALPATMPDSAVLPLDVTFGELRKARAALAKATGEQS